MTIQAAHYSLRDLGLRLLTVACFFQFAGLNNGWLQSRSFSLANPAQSARLVQTLCAKTYFSVHPQNLVKFAGGVRSAVVSVAASGDAWLRKAFFTDTSQISLHSQTAVSQESSSDFSLGAGGKYLDILERQKFLFMKDQGSDPLSGESSFLQGAQGLLSFYRVASQIAVRWKVQIEAGLGIAPSFLQINTQYSSAEDPFSAFKNRTHDIRNRPDQNRDGFFTSLEV